MTLPIPFGDTNSGFQVGINHGQIEAQFHIVGNINIQNITTLRPLADSIYTSLFSAPDTFTQVRNELGLLLSVLKITEEQISNAGLNEYRSTELNDLLIGCHVVLEDLQRVKTHYDEVGFQTQATWERMGWGVDELAEIRARFSSYIQVLNLLNTNMIRSSQDTVVNMLKTYIKECQSGKREAAAMSCVSTGSLDEDEKEAWRGLRKDLQSIGITPDLFQRHRPIILSTIQKHLAPDGREDCPITFSPDAESSRWTEPPAGVPNEELYIPPGLEHTPHDENQAQVFVSQSSFLYALLSEIRQHLESEPNPSLDWKKQLEQIRQYLNIRKGHDIDRAIACKYIHQFQELSEVPGADHAKIVYQALCAFHETRKRSNRGKSFKTQLSIGLGGYTGSGISSHDKIEAGDILSTVPLAVDYHASHTASTDCPICKDDTEIPHVSVLPTAEGSSALDGSEGSSLRPVYNITPSRQKSHCSYLTPQMGYDALCPPSTKAQRPSTTLPYSSSFAIPSDAGNEVYFQSPIKPLHQHKPSRVVVPRTKGPSYFPPPYQPSQNEIPPQYRRFSYTS